MGGQTHEQPLTVAADATENTTVVVDATENTTTQSDAEGKAEATNEIAPETENPTAQGETSEPVADANPQGEAFHQ